MIETGENHEIMQRALRHATRTGLPFAKALDEVKAAEPEHPILSDFHAAKPSMSDHLLKLRQQRLEMLQRHDQLIWARALRLAPRLARL